jgi:hypothetical protein
MSFDLRYNEDFILLAKGETVLQGMIDRLINIGTYCGMENNLDKTTNPTTDYDRSKKTEVCGIFQPFVLLGKIFTCETECRISVPKAGLNKKKARCACELG